jgi:transposase
MEACSGANYWAREFQKLGHEVELISPQFVKPFVKTNKNDANDSEAIIEAMSRPSMRFVPIKQTWQQDIQNIHRVKGTHSFVAGNLNLVL